MSNDNAEASGSRPPEDMDVESEGSSSATRDLGKDGSSSDASSDFGTDGDGDEYIDEDELLRGQPVAGSSRVDEDDEMFR